MNPPTPTSQTLAVRTRSGVVPRAGSIPVDRVTRRVPKAGTKPAVAQDDRTIGVTEYGKLSVAGGVVASIAGRAVLDVADAGGVAPTVLGVRLPGGHLGVRETSLDSPPKTTATVDGTTAFVATTVSVRWPAPIARVADEVRASIRAQVEHMANVTVAEVEVRVDAVTDREPRRARVR